MAENEKLPPKSPDASGEDHRPASDAAAGADPKPRAPDELQAPERPTSAAENIRAAFTGGDELGRLSEEFAKTGEAIKSQWDAIDSAYVTQRRIRAGLPLNPSTGDAAVNPESAPAQRADGPPAVQGPAGGGGAESTEPVAAAPALAPSPPAASTPADAG
jgi:hypothetical protein